MRDFESPEDEFNYILAHRSPEEAIVFVARAIYHNMPNLGMCHLTEAVRQHERQLNKKELDDARAILESRRRSEG